MSVTFSATNRNSIMVISAKNYNDNSAMLSFEEHPRKGREGLAPTVLIMVLAGHEIRLFIAMVEALISGIECAVDNGEMIDEVSIVADGDTRSLTVIAAHGLNSGTIQVRQGDAVCQLSLTMFDLKILYSLLRGLTTRRS